MEFIQVWNNGTEKKNQGNIFLGRLKFKWQDFLGVKSAQDTMKCN